jgi:selenocysteine-specific elongation factor
MTYLSPIAKKALEQLAAQGAAGLDFENEPNALFRRTYGELERMGLAVQTETPWLYSHEGWSQLAGALCGAGTLGKQWKIADVKELLGVTRKPILGILNKLEEQGWLERKEDHRVVIKEFGR